MAGEGQGFEPEEKSIVQAKGTRSGQGNVQPTSDLSQISVHTPIDIIQHRTATAETPEEAEQWLKIRREYLAQNEAVTAKQHARMMMVINASVKGAGMIGLLASGVALAFHSATVIAGLFLVGCGVIMTDLEAGKAILNNLVTLVRGKKDESDVK